MATVKQLLITARELIAAPENWTTEALARNAAGERVPPESDEATCFCSLGALARASLLIDSTAQHRNSLMVRAARLLDRMVQAFAFNRCVEQFNDRHSHDEVLEMWDRAIELVD